MRRIEAAGVTNHAGKAGVLLHARDRFGIRPAIGERNFHLHMLSCLHALHGLGGVHLRGRAENGCVDAWLGQRFGQIRAGVRNSIFRGNGLSWFKATSNDGRDFHVANGFDGVEVFLAKGAGAGEHDFHQAFSRMM
jgi:hypothetical protein